MSSTLIVGSKKGKIYVTRPFSKITVHRMQRNQLSYNPEQEESSGKVGIEEIL